MKLCGRHVVKLAVVAEVVVELGLTRDLEMLDSCVVRQMAAALELNCRLGRDAAVVWAR